MFTPFVRISPVRSSLSQRAHPVMPQARRFAPLRDEVREAAALLEESPEYGWTLDELAGRVHLSESQFGRVFTDAYGLTPLAFQRMLRAKRLAELLRETTLTIEQAMRQVGWHSRGHAARLFREHIGLPPAEYRQRLHQQ